MGGKTLRIQWEYEDRIAERVNITTGMYSASVVDIVRLYPYVEIDGKRYYIEEGH